MRYIGSKINLLEEIKKVVHDYYGIGNKTFCDLFADGIDNKSYSKEYNLPKGQQDEMCKYIDENQKRDGKINSTKWWDNFSEKVKSENISYKKNWNYFHAMKKFAFQEA